MEKIPEQCFATTLTSHSAQAQILHITNARPRFWPDWASSGVCSVCNAYMQELYIVVQHWRVTSGVPTLYRHYMYAMCSSVEKMVMVMGLDSSLQSTILHPVPSMHPGRLAIDFVLCRAFCRSYRVGGGCGFLGC